MSSGPLVYGHRGQRGAPENTLMAFEQALRAGADGVELDVRVCGSGEVVVVHDPTLARVAGRKDAVAELDYAALAGVDVGGARVPLLRDALELVLPQGKRVNVEVKHDVPDLERVVLGAAAELAARPAHEQALVVVSSFHGPALSRMRSLLPHVALGFLYGDAKQLSARPDLPDLGEHPRHALVDETNIAALRARAAFVNVWTVNDAAEARRLAALGVDGIISDVPALIRCPPTDSSGCTPRKSTRPGPTR